MVDQAKADACGAPATRVITWPDDDRTPACDACALSAVEVARQHGTVLKVEALK